MTCPPTSTVWPAAPESLPSSAILPSLTPTSPLNAGIPEPSTIRPFLISRSYAIGFPPLSRCACCYFLPRTIAQECRGPRQNLRAAVMRYTAVPAKKQLAASLLPPLPRPRRRRGSSGVGRPLRRLFSKSLPINCADPRNAPMPVADLTETADGRARQRLGAANGRNRTDLDGIDPRRR